MLSPSIYTLHPFLLFFQGKCGIGSGSGDTGPCTGTLGAGINSTVLPVFSGGLGQLFAIGLALLAVIAILAIIAMIRRALGDKKKAKEKPSDKKGDAAAPDASAGDSADTPTTYVCEICRASVVDEDGAICDDCYVRRIEELQPGEAWCAACDVTYASEGTGCPCCGEGGYVDEDWRDSYSSGDSAASEVCAICGGAVDDDDSVESMFGPVHLACIEDTEVDARRSEVDDEGPENAENPAGIGAQDAGWRE